MWSQVLTDEDNLGVSTVVSKLWRPLVEAVLVGGPRIDGKAQQEHLRLNIEFKAQHYGNIKLI